MASDDVHVKAMRCLLLVGITTMLAALMAVTLWALMVVPELRRRLGVGRRSR